MTHQKNFKNKHRVIKDITDDVIETNGKFIESKTSSDKKSATNIIKKHNNLRDNETNIKTDSINKSNKVLNCPICKTKIVYGTAKCPKCGSNIFYRNNSTIFNDKIKIKLLNQSSAITHI